MSVTRARKAFGFESMAERVRRVEGCLEEAKHIREAIDDLARVKDTAILLEFWSSS